MTAPESSPHDVSIEPTELDLDEGGKDPSAYDRPDGDEAVPLDGQEGGAG